MDLFYTTANIYGRKSLCFLANGSSEFFSNISMSAMSIVPILLFSMVMSVDSIVGMLIFDLRDSFQPAISIVMVADRQRKRDLPGSC